MNSDSIQNTPISPIKSDEAIGSFEPSTSGQMGSQTKEFSLNSGQKKELSQESTQSPFELTKKEGLQGVNQEPITGTSLSLQGQDLSSKISSLTEHISKFQSQYPNATLKPAYIDQFNAHAERSINAQDYINKQLGMGSSSITPPSVKHSGAIDILNYFTGSLNQMNNINASLQNLGPKQLTPGKLLSIQVKMNNIQQQVQFFTTAIGKGVDAIKSIMNIQS